jgi:hypothetical protein
MSDRNDKGIKDMLKQAYDIWEKSATEQMVKFARSQAFITAIAQNLEQTLNVTGRVKEITQTTLTMMNLPTRQDIEALNKQMKALRNTMDEINEKLDELMPAGAAASKPKAKRARKTSKS